MSLAHAIQGFLSYGPMTGYDLKKMFDDSVRNFWPATQSQIYRTLRDMADEGLLRVEVVPQTDLPDRKVYHLTEAGLADLRAWLASPPTGPHGRSAWLVQVFFAHHLPNEEIIALFEQHVAQMRDALAHLSGEVQDNVAGRYASLGTERMRLFWQLTLDSGKAHLVAELAWAEQAIERLRALP
ncbi:MAG: PadR family transcriptional regulator [Armatimonadetes bacterium]|nr:PadR family transcriptional regulator [Armatimonadota bacterium]